MITLLLLILLLNSLYYERILLINKGIITIPSGTFSFTYVYNSFAPSLTEVFISVKSLRILVKKELHDESPNYDSFQYKSYWNSFQIIYYTIIHSFTIKIKRNVMKLNFKFILFQQTYYNAIYCSFALNSSRQSAFSCFEAPFTVKIVTKSSSVPSGILYIILIILSIYTYYALKKLNRKQVYLITLTSYQPSQQHD